MNPARVPILLAIAVSTLLGDAGSADAQALWKAAKPLGLTDATTEPVPIGSGDVGGQLRVRLPAEIAARDDWTLRVTIRGTETAVVSARIVDAERLKRRDDGSLDVSVPIDRDGGLLLRLEPAGRVRAVSLFSPQEIRSQQMVSGAVPEYLDPSTRTPSDVWPVADAIALLEAFDAASTPLMSCSTFRIAPRYWLTAGHCISRGENGTPAVFRITTSAYRKAPPVRVMFGARPVASGQRDGVPDPKRSWKDTDLDFAVLEAKDDPDGPVLKLATAEVVAERRLQVLMQFSLTVPPLFKARAIGPSCRIIDVVGTRDSGTPEWCYKTFSHGCSTNEGSSGAAVVEAESPGRLVGLHYRAGPGMDDVNARFNCGISADAIRIAACGTRPSLAKEFTTCP